jgi:DNA-binding response OmpR family regulator
MEWSEARYVGRNDESKLKPKFWKEAAGRNSPLIKGLSLCEQIRALDTRTPIVIFSGNASAADIAAGMRAGANAYLVKPDSSELVPTIMSLSASSPDIVFDKPCLQCGRHIFLIHVKK